MNDYYRVTLEILKSTNTHLYPCSSFFVRRIFYTKNLPKCKFTSFLFCYKHCFRCILSKKTTLFLPIMLAHLLWPCSFCTQNIQYKKNHRHIWFWLQKKRLFLFIMRAHLLLSCARPHIYFPLTIFSLHATCYLVLPHQF